MSKNFESYLSTAPIGQNAGPNESKINWIKYNFNEYFTDNSKKYFDVGPGQGETLIAWRQLGCKNIESVDLAGDVVKHIQKQGFHCDKTDDTTKYLKKRRNHYDVIMLNDVIEHIPQDDLVDFMSAVRGALKSKGVAIIKTPNGQSPHFGAGMYGDITHIQAFTESSLGQLFRSSGFNKFELRAERTPVASVKDFLARYFVCPLYFGWIRLIRAGTFHFSPRILTQAIIAIATKD